MDDLIAAYIDNIYSDELKNEIYRTFSLCDLFEYKDIYSSLIDIITAEGLIEKNDQQDLFFEEIHNKINYILEQHKIQLSDLATLEEKNEIANALYLIQSLENYTVIMNILDSLEDEYEKLASVLAELTTLHQSNILALIDHFDPSILDTLKKYITNKEQQPVTFTIDPKQLREFKIFIKLFGKDTIGHILVDNGIMIQQPFETYLPYIREIINTTDDMVSKNILSVIYMSNRNSKTPLEIYNEYSLDLLNSIDLVTKLEPFIIVMINKVDEYMNVLKSVDDEIFEKAIEKI